MGTVASQANDSPKELPVPPLAERIKQTAQALSDALDELKVFIPPPIQLVITKLAVRQRGMCPDRPFSIRSNVAAYTNPYGLSFA
jgi:hypothetical protein